MKRVIKSWNIVGQDLLIMEILLIMKNNNKIRINSQIFNNKNIYDNDLIELVEQMYKYYIKDRPTAEEALNTLNKIEKNINILIP